MPSILTTLITICGTALAAAWITAFLYRLVRNTVFAALGGVIPAAAIFAFFLYLESQQPIGPYYAVIGLTCAILSLTVGIPVALVTARDCKHRARDQADTR